MSALCPDCGHELPSNHCPTCTELGHLQYVLELLARRQGAGPTEAASLSRLREECVRRRTDLMMPRPAIVAPTPSARPFEPEVPLVRSSPAVSKSRPIPTPTPTLAPPAGLAPPAAPPAPPRKPAPPPPPPRVHVARRTEPSWLTIVLRDHPGDVVIGFGILAVIVAGYIWASINWGQLPPWGMALPVLLFTAMLFGFGYYLMVRAGQRSAGEALWLGTALLIPINAMVLGELPLGQPRDPLNLLVSIVGLVFLAWVAAVVAGHHERQGIRLFLPPFLLLTFVQAALDRDRGLSPEAQTAVLWVATAALLLGVVRINLRLEAPTRVGRREFLGGGLAFMLYAYALLALRLQVWFHPLPLTAYAPLFALAAMAVFHTARCLPRLLGEAKLPVLVPLGYGLLGVGLALVLAAPVPSLPLLFATAVLSAVATATLVQWYGEPFHLWATFVTAFIAWQVWPHLWQQLAARLELLLSVSLGWGGQPLPPAFLGVRLFWPAAVLVLLALHFRRREAPRLAAPCLQLAVVLSAVALPVALWQSEAATLTWLAFALPYALVGRVWERPAGIGLAVVLASGAAAAAIVWFGHGSMALVLAAATVGWLALADRLERQGAGGDAQAVLVADLAVASAAIVAALLAGRGVAPVVALLVVAACAAWAAWITHAVVLSYAGLVVAAAAATQAWPSGRLSGAYAVAAVGIAVAADLLLQFPRRRPAIAAATAVARLYGWPGLHAALLLAVLAVLALTDQTWRAWEAVLALAAAGGVAGLATRWYRRPGLTQTAVVLLLGAGAVALDAVGLVPRTAIAWSVTSLLACLALYVVAAFGRRRAASASGLYWQPLVEVVAALGLPAVLLASFGAVGSRLVGPELGLGTDASSALVFGLAALLYTLVTGRFPGPAFACLAVFCGTLAAFELGSSGGVLAGAGATALVAALLALGWWAVSRGCERWQRDERDRFASFRVPCEAAAAVVAAVALLACGSSMVRGDAAWLGVAALLLVTALCLLAAVTHRDAAYARIGLLGLPAAVIWAVSSVEPLLLTASPGLSIALTLLGVLLWSVARPLSRQPEPLLSGPLYETALLTGGLAVAAGGGSPGALLLAAVAFLLPLWSHPSEHWLYLPLALGLTAKLLLLDRVLPGLWQPLTPAAISVGLALLGLALLRWSAPLARRLQLAELPYHQPALRLSLTAATVATYWALSELGLHHTWLNPGLLAAAFAVLGLTALLLLAAWPSPVWVCATCACWGYALWAVTWPPLAQACGPLAAMVLALLVPGYLAYGASLPLKRRHAGYAAPLELTALLTGGAVALALLALTYVTARDQGRSLADLGLTWPAVTVAFVLTGANLAALFRQRPTAELLGFGLLFALAFWWWLLSESDLRLPHAVAAAVFALLLSIVAAWPDAMDRWADRFSRDGYPPLAARGVMESGAVAIGLLALLLTHGSVEPRTPATLLLLAASCAVAAAGQPHSRAPGYTLAAGVLLEAGLLYLLVYRAIQTVSAGGPGNPYELASYAATFCTVPMAALALLSDLLRRRDDGGEPWLGSLRWVMGLQALLGGAAVAASWLGMPYPPARIHVVQCGVSLGLLATWCFWLALRLESELPVYFGELALACGWFYARFAAGLPERWDAWVMLACGVTCAAAGRLLQRQGPFSRPLLLTSLVLPVVPLSLLWLKGYAPHDQVSMVLVTALFYAGVWKQTGQAWAGVVFSLLFELALCLQWLHERVEFARHLQYYMIPGALLALGVAHAHRAQLGRERLNQVRWGATGVIYLAAGIDLLSSQIAFSQWAFVMLLAAGGVVGGLALRLRAFFDLGALMLLATSLTLLADNALANPGGWVILLVSVGVPMIVGGAYWSKLRERWQGLSREME